MKIKTIKAYLIEGEIAPKGATITVLKKKFEGNGYC